MFFYNRAILFFIIINNIYCHQLYLPSISISKYDCDYVWLTNKQVILGIQLNKICNIQTNIKSSYNNEGLAGDTYSNNIDPMIVLEYENDNYHLINNIHNYVNDNDYIFAQVLASHGICKLLIINDTREVNSYYQNNNDYFDNCKNIMNVARMY